LLLTPARLSGKLRVPSSKSETHRSLILAAHAREPLRIDGPLISQDTRSSFEALEAFGSVIEDFGDRWVIDSRRFGPANSLIDCGNSGSTLRLFTALAALLPASVEFRGDASLSQRPNEPLLGALIELGARVESRAGGLPIAIRGPLRGGKVKLAGGLSSQFASALLLALPFAEEDSQLLIEAPVRSRPYLDLTVAMAQQSGLSLLLSETASGDLSVLIPGQQSLQTTGLRIGGDWSSAALLLVAALLSGGQLELEGLDPTSAQGDRRIIDILRLFNVVINFDGHLKLEAHNGLVSPGRIDVSQTPDLFPPLCAVAACAEGETLLLGGPGLRHKECDRIAAMAAGLRAAGIFCSERGDALLIRGGKPRAGQFQAQGDHRVHMSLAAIALAADAPSRIDSAWSTVVSYPQFHADLQRLAGVSLL
jgi:3-phosphoshikimate 1-carboxyvinyltransferase